MADGWVGVWGSPDMPFNEFVSIQNHQRSNSTTRGNFMNNLIVPCSSCGRKNRIPASKQHLLPKCGHCQAAISLKNQAVPVELGDHDFHDFVKQASLPVMVDFFSPSCGPCQTMMPSVNAMAREHVNNYIIATVDTSKHLQIPSFFNIRGVPTFLFFKAGSLIEQISGAVARNVLEQKLQRLKI
jgi:thioredoxin 2